MMASAGIEKALVTGFDERTSARKAFMTNEVIAGLAGRWPDRFIPFACVDV
ncbi:MAG: hypothetical protein HYV63_04690 [Candidatus Schekmanbacteria bacterium]|nr:hypothetical protein [Candidatus Schekmanbacteria bacterium]